MTDRLIPIAPGESIVVTGGKLSGHINTSHDRYRVTDGRPAPVPDPVPVPAPAPVPTITYISSITTGILSGKVRWVATVTSGMASKVEFYVDGKLVWTEMVPPYQCNGDPDGLLDTTTLADGSHVFAVLAYDQAGKPGLGGFAGGTATIANGAPVPIPDPTPPPPATTPSGIAIPASAPAGWKRLYTQPFTTPIAEGSFPGPLAPHMGAYPYPWTDTSKNGRYEPKIISVHDEMLDISMRWRNGEFLVAAPTITPNGVSDYTSGRYTFVFKIDPVSGCKTAWLLWPKSGIWPRDGEIDGPERNLTSGHVDGFTHLQGATSGGDQWNVGASFDLTKWHEWTTAWRGGTSVEYFLDRKSLGRTTTRVPNTPMHFVIQTETALDGSKPAAGAAGHVYIDWLTMDEAA